ncbi:endolytic transglycosylase MltG [Idiomarina sp. HP20-50]|uniref:endolytic transglycosylase MltG n=1 Tax=Idiomarina sp. HP20-50 TaxID=3070813 RepID=UPI00294B8D4C|nr:endolytic transglycosylase MltG [Idiomarina sp. HP20-50]MDV6315065.1 endolytic transglycosylase MltG [Idiomarina sp. HP20-50]
MKIRLPLLLLVAALLLTVVVAVLSGRWYLSQPIKNEATTPLLLDFRKGATARSVTQRITEYFGTGHQALIYRLSQVFSEIDHLQAGLYEIEGQKNWFDVWNALSRGDEKTFSVTLVEGLTYQQWLAQLKQQPYLVVKADEMSETSLMKTLGVEAPSLEGVLLPETYSYRAHTTDLEILQQAHISMMEVLEQTWEERSSRCPVNSPYELLILASIIEKETGIAGERALVASVFANRLSVGMRLQSDPTTIYGIDNFDGNLTRTHLREKTAYNTYRIDGLPPTPIAMPGKAAIEAAANPARSPYYYFVADKSGGHVFSKTLEEHQQAVRRYQLNQE